jgi:hypothetical protein
MNLLAGKPIHRHVTTQLLLYLLVPNVLKGFIYLERDNQQFTEYPREQRAQDDV